MLAAGKIIYAKLCLIFLSLTADLFKPGLGNLMKSDLPVPVAMSGTCMQEETSYTPILVQEFNTRAEFPCTLMSQQLLWCLVPPVDPFKTAIRSKKK